MPQAFSAPGRMFQVVRGSGVTGNRPGAFKVGFWSDGDVFTEEEFRRIHPCPKDADAQKYYDAAFHRLMHDARYVALKPEIYKTEDGKEYDRNAGKYGRSGVVRLVDPSEGLTPTPLIVGAPETFPPIPFVEPMVRHMDMMGEKIADVFAQKMVEHDQKQTAQPTGKRQ